VHPVTELKPLYRLLSMGAGLAAALLGAAGCLAWATEVPYLPDETHAVLGRPRPETAVALILAGVALVLLVGEAGRARRLIGRILALAAATIGAFGVVDLLTDRTRPLLPLRRLVGGQALEAPLMTAAAATGILLLGLAMITLDLPARRQVDWPRTFAPAAGCVALVTVLAYVFKLTGTAPALATLMAMPASVAATILALSLGILVARPDRGLLRPFGSAGLGGAFARRIVPALILVPLSITALSVLVIHVGKNTPPVAFSLSTALAVMMLVLVLGHTVHAIDRTDADRQRIHDELAVERDFVKTLLHSLSEAVIVFDPDLRVRDVNRRACQLVGRDRAEMIGQRPPYPWQPRNEPIPTVGSGGPRAADRYLCHSDGTDVPVLARMAPVLDEDGRPRAFVCTFVDISAHKQAEQALAERAADLERVNDELRRGTAQLGEATDFKRDLMSLVSHEVSQPLSSVASLAELLATDWADLPDDVRLELAQKVDKNTRRLTRMINDMLLLFRLDAGAVTARPDSVPVGEVVETVADSAPATAQIVISGDPDVCALVERGHLWQVLSNLVSNAMTYGEPPIEITTRRVRGGVLVSVRDHGAGIPAERLPHLFDRITPRSGGSSGRTKKGSGLGLFIVRHLVEINGGSIWYEDADPRGACFCVRLEPAVNPLSAEPAPTEVAAPAGPPEAAAPKVAEPKVSEPRPAPDAAVR
jgi:PAS domain S-box-containing protein